MRTLGRSGWASPGGVRPTHVPVLLLLFVVVVVVVVVFFFVVVVVVILIQYDGMCLVLTSYGCGGCGEWKADRSGGGGGGRRGSSGSGSGGVSASGSGSLSASGSGSLSASGSGGLSASGSGGLSGGGRSGGDGSACRGASVGKAVPGGSSIPSGPEGHLILIHRLFRHLTIGLGGVWMLEAHPPTFGGHLGQYRSRDAPPLRTDEQCAEGMGAV